MRFGWDEVNVLRCSFGDFRVLIPPYIPGYLARCRSRYCHVSTLSSCPTLSTPACGASCEVVAFGVRPEFGKHSWFREHEEFWRRVDYGCSCYVHIHNCFGVVTWYLILSSSCRYHWGSWTFPAWEGGVGILVLWVCLFLYDSSLAIKVHLCLC